MRNWQETTTSAPALQEAWTPARPTVASDVAVPLAQAAVLGVLAGGLLSGAAIGIFGAAWWCAPTCIAILTLAAFLWRLDSTERTLWRVERAIGRDLDGDKTIGPPVSAPVILDGYRGREQLARDRAAQERREFADFVTGCERNTSGRFWEPKIGRQKYTAWRDVLLSAGWAAMKSDNAKDGWTLTAPASEVLDALDA